MSRWPARPQRPQGVSGASLSNVMRAAWSLRHALRSADAAN